MLKKSVTSFLICAVMLLATVPSRAIAQTLAQPAAAATGQRSSDGQAKAKPDLKAAFAEATARTKAGTSLGANIKRLESEALKPQTQSGYSRKQKILVIAIVAGLVVLAVVLAFTTEKGGHSFCDVDPGDPDCIGPR